MGRKQLACGVRRRRLRWQQRRWPVQRCQQCRADCCFGATGRHGPGDGRQLGSLLSTTPNPLCRPRLRPSPSCGALCAAAGGKSHSVVVTKDGQSFGFGLNTMVRRPARVALAWRARRGAACCASGLRRASARKRLYTSAQAWSGCRNVWLLSADALLPATPHAPKHSWRVQRQPHALCPCCTPLQGQLGTGSIRRGKGSPDGARGVAASHGSRWGRASTHRPACARARRRETAPYYISAVRPPQTSSCRRSSARWRRPRTWRAAPTTPSGSSAG